MSQAIIVPKVNARKIISTTDVFPDIFSDFESIYGKSKNSFYGKSENSRLRQK